MNKRLCIKKIVACALALVVAMGMTTFAGNGQTVQAAPKVKSIKFKKKGYTLSKKGKKVNLSKQITFNPKKPNSKKVSYKSSSKKVATVSSKGVVTAKKKGTVTITATSKSNKKAKATTKVTVGKTVSTLKFKEGTKKTLKATSKFTLHPTYSPKSASTKSVTYKSSNTKVATVTSKGVVTAKAAGTAKITATCKDARGKTATMTVTVPAYVTGVSVRANPSSLYKGDVSTVTATTKGSSSRVTYKWTTSNSRVASISGSGKSIKVTGGTPGTATIKVEAYNGNNVSSNHKTATCKITVGDRGYEIARAGDNTFHNVNVVVPSTTTGTVNLNDSTIKTLTLQPGNYTVNVNGSTTIEKVETTSRTDVKSRAISANNVPILNLKNRSEVDELIINNGLIVHIESTYATLKDVEVNHGAEITSVEGAKKVETMEVNTTREVTVQVPVEALEVNDQTTLNVKSTVDTLTVGSASTINFEEAGQATTLKVEVSSPTEDPVEIKTTGSTETTPVGKLEVNTESQKVDVGAPVGTLDITKNATVNVTAKVDSLNVTSPSTVGLNAGADVGKVTVNVPTSIEPVDITTKDGAKVTEVKLEDSNQAQVAVEGEGEVTEVIVPSGQVDNVEVDTQGTEIKPDESTPGPTTKGYIKATKTSLNGTTTFSNINAASAKFKIKKGDHISYLMLDEMNQIMTYFFNPAAAYTRWKDISSYTDYSGIVSINGVAGEETKTVTIDGTSTRDGVYTVTLAERHAGSEYQMTIVDKDHKTHNITITKTEDTVRASSAKYVAEAKVEGDISSCQILRRDGGVVVFSIEKNSADQTYTIKALDNKAEDVDIWSIEK